VVGITGSIARARIVPPSGPLLVQTLVPAETPDIPPGALTIIDKSITMLNKRNKKEAVFMNMNPSHAAYGTL
jgi:hypothetical protein